MQVTPLRHSRRYINETQTAPRFGAQTYLTNASDFLITYSDGQWHVSPYWTSEEFNDAVYNTGLYDTSFRRRKDAVFALQQMLDSLEVSA